MSLFANLESNIFIFPTNTCDFHKQLQILLWYVRHSMIPALKRLLKNLINSFKNNYLQFKKKFKSLENLFLIILLFHSFKRNLTKLSLSSFHPSPTHTLSVNNVTTYIDKDKQEFWQDLKRRSSLLKLSDTSTCAHIYLVNNKVNNLLSHPSGYFHRNSANFSA